MDFLQLGQEMPVIQSFHHPGITACPIFHERNTQSNTRTDSTMSGMTVRFTRHAIPPFPQHTRWGIRGFPLAVRISGLSFGPVEGLCERFESDVEPIVGKALPDLLPRLF
jgi:hypothetical protein